MNFIKTFIADLKVIGKTKTIGSAAIGVFLSIACATFISQNLTSTMAIIAVIVVACSFFYLVANFFRYRK